jgi:hypothetical protein
MGIVGVIGNLIAYPKDMGIRSATPELFRKSKKYSVATY